MKLVFVFGLTVLVIFAQASQREDDGASKKYDIVNELRESIRKYGGSGGEELEFKITPSDEENDKSLTPFFKFFSSFIPRGLM